MDDVDVTFLRNGTPIASISFEVRGKNEGCCHDLVPLLQAPLICDYQTTSYTLTIEDITGPRGDLAPIESTYTGRNRQVTEVVTLTIDHNYMLFVSVIENHFRIEVSQSVNFSKSSVLCIGSY